MTSTRGSRKAIGTLAFALLFLAGHSLLATLGVGSPTSSSRHILTVDYTTRDCKELHKIPDEFRCEFVQQCIQTRGYINFLYIHECLLSAAPAVSFVFQFLFLVFSFMFLGASAEDYFCPTLEWAADILHMSHNTAGVTILAIGNAAADISSTMVGISHGAVTLAFGGVIGSAVFVSTFVVGLVVIVRPGFKVFRRPFLRDVIYYIICISFFFFILLDGRIHAWEAILLVSLYFIYVAIVLVGRKIYQDRKKRRVLRSAVLEQTIAGGMGLSVDTEKTTMDAPLLDSEGPTTIQEAPDYETPQQRMRALSERITRFELGQNVEDLDDLAIMISNIDVHHALELAPEPIEVEMNYEVAEEDDESPEDLYERKVSPLSLGWVHLFRRHVLRMTKWPVGEKWTTQVLYVFAGPIDLICRGTIPLVGEEYWNRWLAIFHLLACPVLFVQFTGLWGTMLGPLPLWALFLIIFGMLAVVLFFMSKTDPKIEKWQAFFGMISFVMAITWMYVAARELVALLLSFGIISGLSPTILGIVLAWGNSLGDFFADVMIAKAGNPLMGFSAAISGPTINLLIGVGGSFMYTTLVQHDPTHIPMMLENWIIVGFVFLSYFSTLISVIASKWHVNKWYGWYLVIVYLVFLLLSVILEAL